MLYTIYKTINLINNKYYIGKHQTFTPNDGYLGSGKYLKRAIKKYGIENFKKEVLHIFDNEEEMNSKEKELVNLGEDSYNICEGGKGGFGYINKTVYTTEKRLIHNKKASPFKNFTKEQQKKYSTLGHAATYRKHGTYFTQRYDWTGKKHREETKRAIGLKNSMYTGQSNSQYGTCWITNGNETKKIKKETLDEYLNLGYTRGRTIGK